MLSSREGAITTYFNVKIGLTQRGRAGLKPTASQSQDRSSTTESLQPVLKLLQYLYSLKKILKISVMK
jgi:hypothetical protein